MKTAALYARQSIEKEESLSISTQLQKCKDILNPNEPFEEYKDPGYSGKNTSRPDYQRMVADIKADKISKVIVYKLDRLNREPKDYYELTELTEAKKIPILSATERFDMNTETGQFLSGLLMNFAKLERTNTVRRVTDNYYSRADIGGYLGGPAPFGFSISTMKHPQYNKEIKYLVPNSNMKYVREMYKKYLVGESLSKIAEYLNNNKVVTPDFDRDLTKRKPRKGEGNRKSRPAWDSGKVSRLMRNVNYAIAAPSIYNYFLAKGAQIHNGIEEFQNTDRGLQLVGKRPASDRKYTKVTEHTLYLMWHKGVIESDIWLEAQHKLDQNHQIANSGKGKYSWLSGLVKCGKCGGSLIVKYSLTRKGEKKYIYLFCSGRMNHGQNHCAGFQSPLKLEDIEPEIDRMFLNRLKNFNSITPAIDIPSEIREKESEREANKAQLSRYLKAIGDGAEWGMIKKEVERLENEEIRLNAEINQLYLENSESQRRNIEEIIDKWDTFDVNEKREIAKAFINKIEISEDENGEITASIIYKIDRPEESI